MALVCYRSLVLPSHARYTGQAILVLVFIIKAEIFVGFVIVIVVIIRIPVIIRMGEKFGKRLSRG